MLFYDACCIYNAIKDNQLISTDCFSKLLSQIGYLNAPNSIYMSYIAYLSNYMDFVELQIDSYRTISKNNKLKYNLFWAILFSNIEDKLLHVYSNSSRFIIGNNNGTILDISYSNNI